MNMNSRVNRSRCYPTNESGSGSCERTLTVVIALEIRSAGVVRLDNAHGSKVSRGPVTMSSK